MGFLASALTRQLSLKPISRHESHHFISTGQELLMSGCACSSSRCHAGQTLTHFDRVIPLHQRMVCVSKRFPIALFVLLASTFVARTQQSGPSAGPIPAWNDNALITVQKNGGDPTRSGDVKIEFRGHNAFKITSPAGLAWSRSTDG